MRISSENHIIFPYIFHNYMLLCVDLSHETPPPKKEKFVVEMYERTIGCV